MSSACCPTSTSLAELFRHQPPLAAELAAALGVDVPRFTNAKVEPSDFADVMPTEWRSDGIVALTDDVGRRAMSIVVEVQRGWPKGEAVGQAGVCGCYPCSAEVSSGAAGGVLGPGVRTLGGADVHDVQVQVRLHATSSGRG